MSISALSTRRIISTPQVSGPTIAERLENRKAALAKITCGVSSSVATAGLGGFITGVLTNSGTLGVGGLGALFAGGLGVVCGFPFSDGSGPGGAWRRQIDTRRAQAIRVERNLRADHAAQTARTVRELLAQAGVTDIAEARALAESSDADGTRRTLARAALELNRR